MTKSKALGAPLVVLALLALSVALRLPSYDGRPLWADEMWRALVALDPTYLYHYFFAADDQTAITAPIYAFLIKLASLSYVSPWTLRLSSLAPGVAAPLLAYAVIRKAGGSLELSALGALVFSFNSTFIHYSSELKPYVFEICVHLAAVYVWLCIIAKPAPTPRTWTLLFATLLLAVLATAGAVLLLPSFGVSLFLIYLARRDWKSIGICAAGFSILGALVLCLYVWAWRPGANQGMLIYWAPGFAPAGSNYLAFLGSQLLSMWNSAFYIPLKFFGLGELALTALVVALVTAIVSGSGRRTPLYHILIFYLMLLVTMTLINFLGLWPLGALRPNLFLFGHMILFLFLVSAQVFLSRIAAQLALGAGALGLLWFVANTALHRTYFEAVNQRLHAIGPPVEQSNLVIEDFSSSGPVGKSIAADCAKNRKTTIIVDEFMATAIIYYSKYDTAHRAGTAILNGPCVNRIDYGEAALAPEATAKLFAKSLPAGSDGWTLYSHLGPQELAVLKQVAGRVGQIRQSHDFVRAGYFYF